VFAFHGGNVPEIGTSQPVNRATQDICIAEGGIEM